MTIRPSPEGTHELCRRARGTGRCPSGAKAHRGQGTAVDRKPSEFPRWLLLNETLRWSSTVWLPLPCLQPLLTVFPPWHLLRDRSVDLRRCRVRRQRHLCSARRPAGSGRDRQPLLLPSPKRRVARGWAAERQWPAALVVTPVRRGARALWVAAPRQREGRPLPDGPRDPWEAEVLRRPWAAPIPREWGRRWAGRGRWPAVGARQDSRWPGVAHLRRPARVSAVTALSVVRPRGLRAARMDRESPRGMLWEGKGGRLRGQ